MIEVYSPVVFEDRGGHWVIPDNIVLPGSVDVEVPTIPPLLLFPVVGHCSVCIKFSVL